MKKLTMTVAVLAFVTGCSEDNETPSIDSEPGAVAQALDKAAPIPCDLAITREEFPDLVAAHDRMNEENRRAAADWYRALLVFRDDGWRMTQAPYALGNSPDITVEVRTPRECALATKVVNNQCRPVSECPEYWRSNPYRPIGESTWGVTYHTWREILSVLIARGNRVAAEGWTDPWSDGNFTATSLFPQGTPRAAQTILMNALLEVIRNETLHNAAVSWGLPLILERIPISNRESVRMLARKFWDASGTNCLTYLKKAAEAASYATKDEANRFTGLFCRRYDEAGRGTTGDQVLTRLRFTLVLLAEGLDMPEAAEWRANHETHTRVRRR